MARKQKPIDPTEGPLQAFAYDLRAVRETAGNPTYRALAELAGFSATTLSDAAGGVRLPSLEVTLAYVGACGADAAPWQERWHELDRLLESDRARESAGGSDASGPAARPSDDSPGSGYGGPGSDVPMLVSPTAEPAPAARPGRRRRWVAAAALALVVLCGLLVARFPDRHGEPRKEATPVTFSQPPGCPPWTEQHGAFSGASYGSGARIRSGASLNAPVVLQLPAGCRLEFTGYCLGDVVIDQTSASPDMRWFKVLGGGVVASAVVHGNPPVTMAPSDCTDGAPLPESVSLSIARHDADPDQVDLRATGSKVGIVGYAADIPAGSGGPNATQWRQIGMSGIRTTDFLTAWRLGPVRSAFPERGPVRVVAVACMGGDGPTRTLDARLFRLDDPSSSGPAEVRADEIEAATRAACRFPNAG